ncbi:MAG: DinB family protein [Candidatus Deferrimicrobiaceae bacterium]
MAGGVERNVISLLREQLKTINELLEGTVDDVTQEQAHWIPPGVAMPIGATYAHVVVSQDGVINGMLKGGAPLFASKYAGKTGLSEMPPDFDPEKPGLPDWSAWSRKVKVDLPAFRKYAQAVYAASDEYLATLRGKDLDRPIDLTALGFGQSTVGFLVNNAVLGNAFTHCGEISCLKGLQGKKGYPF